MITRGLCLDEKSPLKELTGPVIVAAIVRDEATMLPWFLKYYRTLGCKSFLIIENGSKDQSVDFLRKQKDVLLYRAPTKDYVESRSGRFWVNTLTRKYALNKWVLCVDTDELLSWPEQDSEKLGGLVKRAERLGLRRVFTPMIDAYADKPTDQLAEYLPGTPFGEICQWVDPPETSKFFWKKADWLCLVAHAIVSFNLAKIPQLPQSNHYIARKLTGICTTDRTLIPFLFLPHS